jgi:hypothetical protein
MSTATSSTQTTAANAPKSSAAQNSIASGVYLNP